uniref:Dirigent protein n=1 Tax=Ananas comosus var. bracteatus TaxID=296719 RepID=A0A6V7P158_ANACO|nr:unnamed protein product [Ananas comosus var. bracteatus]
MASLYSFLCCHHFLLLAVAVLFTTNVVVAHDTTHLNFYMHDILGGPNPTAVAIVKGPVALPSVPGANFGDLIAIDDALTRARALEGSLLLSVNFVLAHDGPYNGSVVSVQGRDPFAAPVRELSVVGGTGHFRMARGYVLWKTYGFNTANSGAILELDVYVTTK